MKRFSLIFKEFLSQFMFGFVYIIIGILGLNRPLSIIFILLAALGLAFELITLFFLKNKRFDIMDESAREHLAKAERLSLLFTGMTFDAFILVILALDISITVNAYHLVIISGVMKVLETSIFIFLEKRDAALC